MGEAGGEKLSAKLAAGGAALAGIGGAFTMMGQKEKQASDQLGVAIQNTGHDMDDFEGQIDKTVHSMEKYGDTAVQTKTALTTLTNATHDPNVALKEMSVTADLAAASHISLEAAAGQVAKALGGSGRIFKQYGIQVGTNKDGTKDYTGAMADLAQVVHGQADAAADNFTGRLKHLRAEVEDGVAEFGQKYGPAITGIGVGLMTLGPAVSGAAGLIKKLGSSSADAAAVSIAADDAAAESTAALAGAVEASTVSQTGSFTQVGTGAQAASTTAIAADEAAEASTSALADAVGASATAQSAAFSRVGTAAEVSAAKTVAANEASTASSAEAAGAAETSKLGSAGAVIGVAALAVGVAALGHKIDETFGPKGSKTIGDYFNAQQHATQSLATLSADVRNGIGSLDDLGSKWAVSEVGADGLADKAAKAGITIDQLSTAITGNKDQMDALIKKWQESGSPSKATLGTVVALIAKIAALPRATGTKVDVNTSAAMAAAKRLHDYLEKGIVGVNWVANVKAVASGGVANLGGGVKANAVGSSFYGGGETWLDEKGPEIVDLPSGSRVHTAAQSRVMDPRPGPPADEKLTVNLYIDGRQIQQTLLALKRRHGGASLGF